MQNTTSVKSSPAYFAFEKKSVCLFFLQSSDKVEDSYI